MYIREAFIKGDKEYFLKVIKCLSIKCSYKGDKAYIRGEFLYN